MENAFMMSFTVEEFAESPDIEILKGIQIADWLKLAKHYDIETENNWGESELRVNVVRALIDKGIIGEEAKELLHTNVMDTSDHLAIERMKLDVDFRKFGMELRAKERKEKDEMEVRKQELAFKKWVERKRMEREINNARQGFDVLKNATLVPPFNEEEVNCYFTHFEKLALRLSWPEECWTLLLQSVLMGKAQEAYSRMSIEESKDYQKVKECILKACAVAPEGCRQEFRNLRVLESQTYVEFLDQKTRLFERWCHSKDVTGNYDRLKELIIIEEFKNCLSAKMKLFLDEKEVQTAHEAALLADVYHLTHKNVSNLSNQNEKLVSKDPETINEQVIKKTVSNSESVKPVFEFSTARLGSVIGRLGQVEKGRAANVTGSGGKAARSRRYRRRQGFRGRSCGRGRGASQSEEVATGLFDGITGKQD